MESALIGLFKKNEFFGSSLRNGTAGLPGNKSAVKLQEPARGNTHPQND
jgi:hypothetical protein